MLRALLLSLLALSVAGQTAKIGILARLHGQDGSVLDREWWRVAASILMAQEHVNRRFNELVPYADQLPAGFNVSVDLQDTSSTPSVGVQHAVKWSGEGFHGIVGAPRSAVSSPVSLVSSIQNLAVVSYWSTAASLSDKGTFPTFNRVIPSDAVMASALMSVCKELNWNRIGVLYIDDAYGSGFAQDIATHAGTNGLQVATSQKFTSGDLGTVTQAVDSVAASQVRIIIAISFADDMEAILMRGHELGMFESGYVWIMTDAIVDPIEILKAFPSNALLPDLLQGWLGLLTDPLYGAKGAKYRAVWEGERFNYPKFVETINTQTAVGATVDDMEGSCELCGYAYDAFWALSIALSKSISSDGKVISKSQTINNIRPSSFLGSTGQVVLSNSGDRLADGLTIVLRNWIPKSSEMKAEIATWTAESGLNLDKEGVVPYWVGTPEATWSIPLDPSNCETGTVFSSTERSCKACPPGTYQELLQCKQCEPGTHAPEQGMTKCLPCREGYADQPGMDTCSSCPANTVKVFGSPGLNQSECECKENYWRPDGKAGAGCVPCAEGGVCLGGPQSVLPFTNEGYWAATEVNPQGVVILSGFPWLSELEVEDPEKPELAFPDLPKIFHLCNYRDNCLMPNETIPEEVAMLTKCKVGQTGYRCEMCDDGYTAIGSFCIECPSQGGSWAMTIMGSVLVYLFWMILLHYTGKYIVLDIALLYIQCVSITTDFAIPWPTVLRYVNQIFRVMTFQVDFVSPQCVSYWDPVSSEIFYVLFPFFLMIIIGAEVVVAWLWLKLVGKKKIGFIQLPFMVTTDREVREHYNYARMKWARGMKKCYPAFCLKLFKAFYCVPIANGESWVFGTDIVCGSAKHRTLLGLAIYGCIFYIAGIPATFAGILVWMRRNDSLKVRSHQTMLGFLYLRYKPGKWYWELVIFARRFFLCLISVYASATPHFQLSLGLFVILFFLSTNLLGSPYWMHMVERVDYLGMGSVALYMVAGFVFTSENIRDSQVPFVVGILLAITAWNLVLAFYQFYLSLNTMDLGVKLNKTVKEVTGGAWMKTCLELKTRIGFWEGYAQSMGVTEEEEKANSLTQAHMTKLLDERQSKSMFGPGLSSLLFNLVTKEPDGSCTLTQFKKAFVELPEGLRPIEANIRVNRINFRDKILQSEDLQLDETEQAQDLRKASGSMWNRFSQSANLFGTPSSPMRETRRTSSGSNDGRTMRTGSSLSDIFSSAIQEEKEWWIEKMADKNLNAIVIDKVLNTDLVHFWMARQLDKKNWKNIIVASLINSWLAPFLVPTSDVGPFSYGPMADLFRKMASFPMLIDWLLDEEQFKALMREGFNKVTLTKQEDLNAKEVWSLVTPQFRPQFLFWLTNKSTQAKRMIIKKFLHDVAEEADQMPKYDLSSLMAPAKSSDDYVHKKSDTERASSTPLFDMISYLDEDSSSTSGSHAEVDTEALRELAGVGEQLSGQRPVIQHEPLNLPPAMPAMTQASLSPPVAEPSGAVYYPEELGLREEGAARTAQAEAAGAEAPQALDPSLSSEVIYIDRESPVPSDSGWG